MPDVVIDETGRELALGDTLGVPGAQGEVRRVVDRPELAVKLLKQRGGIDYEAIRRLPLTNLAISTPIGLLRDGLGYVMELAAGMEPIEELVPRYRPGFGTQHDLDWYVATGGLERRLRLMARTAGILARLHGLALAFVDINPGNVMVSAEAAFDEVMLIDVDNVGHVSSIGAGVHTAGYRVPERMLGRSGPNTLTDAYAFAVLAHGLLRMRYPFDGDAAQDLDGDAALDAMDSGALPYVDDPDDGSNRATTGGLPAAASFSPVLAAHMERTFGPGRRDPSARPSVGAWSDALWRAAENVIACSACGWTYYRTAARCMRCGAARPPLLGVAVRSPGASGRPMRQIVQVSGMRRALTRRMIFGFDSDEPVVTVKHDGKRLQIEGTGGAELLVIASSSDIKAKKGQLGGPFIKSDALRLQVDASESPPRVLDLRCI